ncbi:MAG: methylated-DNA--[protein]-cysteine S-methyltransferase [Verrucomicrobia bacterium]|nr:methylated-DNA--[protein]-cysteine S-methyltransferase [Verrucomicrobiota bacterium]
MNPMKLASDSTDSAETAGMMEQAFADRDGSYDGVFFFAVKTTGIFCRPSCPSRPKRENVEFFRSSTECLIAGYRPCKRCQPLDTHGSPQPWVTELIKRIQTNPSIRLKSSDLLASGVTPERARRWFRDHTGLTFAEWCRCHRLACAFTRIQAGDSLDDAGFEAGFESTSGFRTAFAKKYGTAPGEARHSGRCVKVAIWDSPIGPLIAGAHDEAICLLDYIDRRTLSAGLESLHRKFRCALVPGTHPLLERLQLELTEYFEGRLAGFTVPVAPEGTSFQRKVWHELRRIPSGRTISYDDLATRIGQPSAIRAVARANATNQICILIPCHRVIGKDGALSGYGGGVWRKRLLLRLEQSSAAELHDIPMGTTPPTSPR